MFTATFKRFLLLLFSFKTIDAILLQCSDASSDTCNIKDQNATRGSIIEFANLNVIMTSLTINYCEMAFVVPKIFNLLPKLETLDIKYNKIKILQPKTFFKAINLLTFEAAYNKVVVVKNKLFSKCSNLNYVSFSNNNIKMVAVNAFQGLTNLATLLLNDNVIEVLALNVFATLTELTAINLSGNKLQAIDKDLFKMNGKLDTLELNNNQLMLLADETFSHSQLSFLKLDNNNLTASYRTIIPGSLEIKSNSIQSIHIAATTKGLDCQKNQVNSITCDSPLQMESFDATNNDISNFICIRNMTNAKTLNLQQNKIAVLSKKFFVNLKKLISLDLSFNLLKKVKPQVFAPLLKLKYLRVTKLTNYKTVKTILPKLISVALTSDPWNCSQISTVAHILQTQKIKFEKNFLGSSFMRECACNRSIDQILNPDTKNVIYWFKVDGCN